MNKPTTFLFWLVAGVLLGFIYIYLALAAGIAGFPYGWHEVVFKVVAVVGLLVLMVGVLAAGSSNRQTLRRFSFKASGLIAVGLFLYTAWGAPYFESMKNHAREMTLKNSLPDRARHMLDCAEGYKVAYVREPLGNTGKERRWLVLMPPAEDAPTLFLAKRVSGENLWVSNREESLQPLLSTCNKPSDALTYSGLRNSL